LLVEKSARAEKRRRFAGGMKPTIRPLSLACGLLLAAAFSSARDLQPKPEDAFFTRYEIAAAPKPSGPLLKQGDRLAICGDSITEQRQYSVIMEAYITACLPELGVTVRQFGWSGEQASGFYNR